MLGEDRQLYVYISVNRMLCLFFFCLLLLCAMMALSHPGKAMKVSILTGEMNIKEKRKGYLWLRGSNGEKEEKLFWKEEFSRQNSPNNALACLLFLRLPYVMHRSAISCKSEYSHNK